MSSKAPNKALYDCLNSWGFEEPVVSIAINSPAIKAVFKVVAQETLLTYRNLTNDRQYGNHGLGCPGNCVLDDDKCCSIETTSD